MKRNRETGVEVWRGVITSAVDETRVWWTRVAILTVTRFCLGRQLGSRIWTDIRTLNPPYGFKSVKIFNGFETRMWHITVLKIAKKIYGFKNRIRHLRFRKSYTNFTFSNFVGVTHYTILKTALYYIIYKMQFKGFVSSILYLFTDLNCVD